MPVLQVVLDVPHQALELEQLRRADNLVPGLVAVKIFLHFVNQAMSLSAGLE